MPDHESQQGTKVMLHLGLLSRVNLAGPAQHDGSKLVQQDRQVRLAGGEEEARVGAGLVEEAEEPVELETLVLGQEQEAQLHRLHTLTVLCLDELCMGDVRREREV